MWIKDYAPDILELMWEVFQLIFIMRFMTLDQTIKF